MRKVSRIPRAKVPLIDVSHGPSKHQGEWLATLNLYKILLCRPHAISRSAPRFIVLKVLMSPCQLQRNSTYPSCLSHRSPEGNHFIRSTNIGMSSEVIVTIAFGIVMFILACLGLWQGRRRNTSTRKACPHFEIQGSDRHFFRS